MRIRLKAPFFFQNHKYEAGDIVDLPDGVEGPHGSSRVTHDRIDYDVANGIDANRILGEVKRWPLFEILEEAVVHKPALPSTLADRPIVDRRGDDQLDRATHHVAHPADLTVAGETQAEPASDEKSTDEGAAEPAPIEKSVEEPASGGVDLINMVPIDFI